MFVKLARRGVAASLVVGTLAAFAPACGARTGLDVPDASACAAFEASAELAPLDVFIMMDSSGSMTFVTADGTTKWGAVQAALGAFLTDPESAGIGATIAFFPVVDPAVPLVCTADTDCAQAGGCDLTRICYPSISGGCTVAADCAANPGDTCIQLGQCSLDDQQACLPSGQIACSPGTGPCLNTGYCRNHDRCDAASYEGEYPAAAPLPGAAAGIVSTIAARTPDGATPTLPALTGATSGASAWMASHPGHKAIVILATDGLPTVCDTAIVDDQPSSGIPAVTTAAAAGLAQGIQTYVIGVFTPGEQATAQVNLDTIAAAGGTGSAFLINTNQAVSKLLVQALDQVRTTAKACEFAIPEAGGSLPDLTHLGVRVTPPGGSPEDVTRLPSVTACDPTSGGFFYDQPIGASPPPSRIVLCPATCDLLTGAATRSIEVRVSCP
jgi:hypothetical protein